MATLAYLPSACPATHSLYRVKLQGTHITVTLTAMAAVVDEWIAATYNYYRPFLHKLIVGLGVRWTYRAGRDPPADTLQLCVGRMCLVYQLRYSRHVPQSLREFLLDPDNTFVGFWNQWDRRKLEISRHRLLLGRDPLDMRIHARTDDGVSLEGASIRLIVQECLRIKGVRIKRWISMSRWAREHLSIMQLLQVTMDAHCAFRIGKKIRAWEISPKAQCTFLL